MSLSSCDLDSLVETARVSGEMGKRKLPKWIWDIELGETPTLEGDDWYKELSKAEPMVAHQDIVLKVKTSCRQQPFQSCPSLLDVSFQRNRWVASSDRSRRDLLLPTTIWTRDQET